MDGAKSDTHMRFRVLGPLEVDRDGGRVDIGGRRLRTLLALLLLSPGQTVPFPILVSGVWDGDPPSAVGNALQALVSRLRASLGRDLVAAETSGYRLVISLDRVDAYCFARLVAEGRAALTRGDAAEARRVLAEALALWRGPALADLAGVEAAEAEIARLEGLRLAAIEDRIDAGLSLGAHAEVAGELSPLIAAHPLRERLRGQLMRALYGSGRQVEALAAYEAARTDFAERLGTDPSPELAALHLSILRGAPLPPPPEAHQRDQQRPEGSASGQGEPVPGVYVPGGKKGNLRARLTSFVGREKDVRHTGLMLAEHRLVTLLGPGGAGKTRLAVESGEALADETPDGVWLAELAPVRDPEGVPQAVLAALGLRDTRRAPVWPPGAVPPEPVDLTTRLVAGLGSRRQLIILDNCEHVIDAAARLADRILAECPGVRILATSREPLGITGELLWPVQPLDHEHAQNLFADRAATARPGYVVDGDAVAVARICRELDGMPLAIELAAARLRTLSAAQIADRLDDRFRLLTGGSRTALPRHQTLRAVVEWSWDLLDERERVLARRLAAFAGGATLDAVETVCSGDGLPREQVLDVLARLVDKSLVICDNERYRMLETIRAYAMERLRESGEERPVRLAHARFFTGLAETAEPELRRADQVKWLATLSDEHDNLTAALRWAVGSQDHDLGLRLVGALGWYWFLAGRRSEGAQRAAEVIALITTPETLPTTAETAPCATTPEAPTPGTVETTGGTATSVAPGAAVSGAAPAAPGFAGGMDDDAALGDAAMADIGGVEPRMLALALTVCGILMAGGTNQWHESKAVLLRGVGLARAAVPRPWPAMISLAEPVLGLFRDLAPDPEHFATELFDDPDPWVVASAHLIRAHIHYDRGQIAQGEADVHRALDRFRAVGDRWGVGSAMGALAEVSTLRGDDATTIAVVKEAIALVDEIGAVEDTPYMRTRLAMALSASGDRAGAETVLDQALEICRTAGDRMGESGVHSVRGDLAREEGKHRLARLHYEEAIRLATDPAVFPAHFRALLLSSVGLLEEQEGDLRAARRSHSEALRLAWDAYDGAALGLMLIALAGLVVREGDAARAATLLGAAARLRGIEDVIGYDHVRITETTTAALGPEEYHRCFERGRSMSREEINALVEKYLAEQ
jgi:predicted ATPase/DNA-binding SARP family transcriptional activator